MEDLPNYDTFKLATPPWYDTEEPDESEWTAEDYAADAAEQYNDEH